MVNLNTAPFHLSGTDIQWVEETIGIMTTEEKIGQLLFPIGLSEDDSVNKSILDRFHIGGILFRAMEGEKIQNIHRTLQQHSKIPLILCANVETGGDGIATDGTCYGQQMQVAATGDIENAYALGSIAAKEGAAVGLNLALGPICDIDMNYLNPITNVRTYGSDPDTVRDMALSCARGLRDHGLMVCAKHFPGDGTDDRDQHLLTSVNRLGRKAWDESFGKVYEALIEDGAEAIMAGHISLPSYQSKRQKYSPATLSSDLLTGLLREKLHFNGLIMSDATPMVGFAAAMERRKALPQAVMAGCDVILFNKDLAEDFGYLLDAYCDGSLSHARVDDALRRILGLKRKWLRDTAREATQLVPDKSALSVLSCGAHHEMAAACADRSVTLVKDTCGLIPFSSAKYPRVLLEILGGSTMVRPDGTHEYRVEEALTERLRREGFTVTNYRPESFASFNPRVEDFKASYDLVLYVANVETLSNQTTARLNWHTFFGQGNNIPWFVCEVPTVFVSVGNPYHLLDVPMVPAYINAYCNSDAILDAVIDKLLGKSAFKGVSPVDAFCGRPELRLSPAKYHKGE